MNITQRKTTLACAVSLALACATANAQEGLSTRQGKASELDEIVVTATKRSVDVQTVPLSVTAVSGEALVAKQITNINALDQIIPGLTIHSAGFNTSAIIRGAGSAGTSDTAVPFYTDGMFMPSNVQALATFVDLERVE